MMALYGLPNEKTHIPQGVGFFMPNLPHVPRPFFVDSVGRHHGLWMLFSH